LAYIPAWETLAEALERVIAVGSTEFNAKRDLCAAMTDKKISFQVVLAADVRRHLPEQIAPVVEFDVPARLLANDIDWTKSRPIKRWHLSVRPLSEPMTQYLARKAHLFEREIEAVEVRTSDVIEVLCASGAKVESRAAPPALGRVSPQGAKSVGIKQAIGELWPSGIPNGLAAKERNNKIIEWLRKNGCSVSNAPERTIQRVLRGLN
jgi:hypothetical protein